MHEIVFLDRDTLGGLNLRRPAFPHHWREYAATPSSEVIARARSATILIVNKVRINSEVLAQLEALQLVAIAATGSDLVDLAACRERNVAVTNIRGYAAQTVPEHVFALMLALRRRLCDQVRSVEAGAWSRASTFCLLDHPISDLHGGKLGILGYGSIGQGVARIGAAFGMEPLIAERPGARRIRQGRQPFEEVLAASDALTLHCPLSPETRGLINDATLAKMKPSAILINTARGGLIDDAALKRALEARTIAGAALDVLDVEPPPLDHPLLRDPPKNLLVTPHVAWASAEARQALGDQLIRVLESFAKGEADNRLT